MIRKIQYLTRYFKKNTVQSTSVTSSQQGVTVSRERMVTIHMRMATFGVLCISFVLGVIWIFFFGILVGRGYAPEEHVPQLRQILPEPTTVQADALVVIDNSGTSTVRQNAPVSPTTAPANTATSSEVRPTPGAQNSNPTASSAPATSGERPAPAPSTRRAAEQVVAAQRQVVTPATPQRAQQTAQQQASTNPVTQNQAKFRYQFQVAAFKVKNQAEALQNKLKQDKLAAKVVTSTTDQGVTWHRVVIQFSGTEKDVEALREKLKKHKITTLIRQEKTQL